jgi:hypothetical protein
MMTRQTRFHSLFMLSFWVALAFAITMAMLPSPPHVLCKMSDKYQHMLAFGTLALLAAFAFPKQPLARIGERLSFVGALIEVGQSIPALHRDCDIFDWVADTFALVAMLLVIAALTRRRQHAAQTN